MAPPWSGDARVTAYAVVALQRWRLPRPLGICAFVIVAVAPVVAVAQMSPPSLEQLAHRVWTARDGAPGGIDAIAQTRDGFLWLGGATGLFRFDGVRFEQYRPPDRQMLPSTGINALWASPDGALWVGYRIGGASVITARHNLVSYGPEDGLPGGVVSSFALDSGGTMWAATARGLAYLKGNRWVVADSARGYAGGYTNMVTVDRRGTLWVDGAAGVFSLEKGAQRFTWRAPALTASPGEVGTGGVREAPNGEIWTVSISRGISRLTDTAGRTVTAVAHYDRDRGMERGWAALFIDRLGYAYGEYTHGRLVRVALTGDGTESPGGRVAWDTLVFSPKAGTSGRTVTTVREDREGNVWVATEAGLDQFRVPKFMAIDWPAAIEAPRIAAAENGSVWATGEMGGFFAVGVNGTRHREAPTLIGTVLRDLRGEVWVGGASGVWLRSNGQFSPVTLPPELRQCLISAMARAADGTLWVSGHRRGVFRRRGAAWERYGTQGEYATVLLADSAGGTWIGYPDGRLIREGERTTQTYTVAAGLTVGSVLSLAGRGSLLLVGGDRGVAVLDLTSPGGSAGETHPHIVPLVMANEQVRSVSGIVATDDGVWLRDAGGVARIPSSELARAVRQPGYQVHAERFDTRDRVDGPAYYTGPSALQATDGRVWVSWIGGLGWIDPAHVHRNAVPPPVMVRALAAGGRTYADSMRVRLPVRTSALSIAYTALSLSVPERVQFRYRLVGLDTTWQDAGPRREAFYTNLRPGTYRFEVTASNDDGVWSVAPAALDIVIPPAFMQSNAFLALCITISGGALWLLVVSRQRRAVASERARQQVILAERLRVARELHDTLLTDVAGLRMQLDAAARAASSDGVAAELFTRLGDQAGDALESARKAVVDMRATGDGVALIAEQLAEAARRIFSGTNVEVRAAQTGTPRRYAPTVEGEALRIAGEALVNARAHASCRTVFVTCVYRRRELRIEVRDDGRGFDPSRAATNEHFGLVGMRERAGVIGARLTVDSAPGRGTAVVLTMSGGTPA